MRVTVARIISFMFNPLMVMVFAPYVLVSRTTHDSEAAFYWTIYTLIFLMVLSLFVVIAVKKKIFTDLDVSKREQRPLVFFVGLLLATIYMISLFVLHAPYILYVLVIGIMLGVCFVSIINRWVKASVHMATITALILPVAVSFGQYYLLLLFLIPLLAWARISAKRHTLPEVLVGTTIGGILSMSLYIAVKFFINR